MEQLSVVSKIVLLDLIVPWPLDNRDLVLVGHGYNLLAEKGIIVVTLKSPTLFEENELYHFYKSCDENDPIEKEKHFAEQRMKIKRYQEQNSKGKIRMEAVGHVLFKYVDEHRCFCQVQLKIDVKLSYIPVPILNFVTRTVASTVFAFYKRRCLDVYRDGVVDDACDMVEDGDVVVGEYDNRCDNLRERSDKEGEILNMHRSRIESGSEFYTFVIEAIKSFEESAQPVI